MRFDNAFEGIGAGPVVAGAAAFGILLGLAGGTSIDTTPLERGRTFSQLIPERQPVAYDRADIAPAPYRPDHFAQVTRNGRIEVPELRSYILRHERPAYFVYAAELDPVPDEAVDEAAVPLSTETPFPPPPPDLHLSVATVPGTLKQASAPAGREPVLEPAVADYSRPVSTPTTL